MAILGTLEVRLHGGKDMKNVEFLGKNDPYAIISYKTQDQKSKTLEGGGADPVWNQMFFFKVDEDNGDVVIKILDEDKHSADDIIGEAKIPLNEVFSELEVPARHYDLVRPSGDTGGQIEVSLKFVPKVASEEVPQHHTLNQYHNNPSIDGPYGNNNGGGWQ